MKKLIYLVMSIAMSLFAADASAQYIPVTTPSSCIVDGSGSTITAGTMIVVGTDANDNPIPYRAGTSAMATTAPISRSIVNGALLTSLQLADPASTSPTNVLYRFVIQDNLSKKITVYKQIIVAINDLGTNFNFCKMNPLPFTTQIQFAAAPFSFSGDWNLLGHLSVALSSTFSSSITTPTLIGPAGQAVNLRGGSGTTFAFAIQNALSTINLLIVDNAGNISTPTFAVSSAGAITGLSLGTGQIIQPAATIATWKDNTGGIRASIPSNGTSQGTLNNWNLTGGSSINGTAVSGTSGTGNVVFDTSPSITTPTIARETINTGISQGSGFKHQRFGALCTTAAAAGANCTTAVTWTSAFADSSYTPVCIGVTALNAPALTIEAVTASGFTIRIFAIVASATTFATVDCTAVHD